MCLGTIYIYDMRMGYEDLIEGQVTLRDQLAIDRTDMANSRTFLAYIRTVVLIMLTGFTVIKLQGTTTSTRLFLILCLGMSISGLVYGIMKYHYYKKQMHHVAKIHPVGMARIYGK